MSTPFTIADGVLLVVVALMAVAVAYIPTPRAKSLVYMLPLPFSAALVSTGKGVDATHVIGFGMVWAFLWMVWLFHARWRIPILVSNGLAIVINAVVGLVVAKVVPSPDSGGSLSSVVEPWLFWGFAGLIAALAAAGLALPHREEASHRSPMRVLIKVPLVFLLVTLIILAKEYLRGFMPAFPMVTVFAVYEARHSLYTLAAGMPIFLLGCVPLLIVCRLLIPYHPASWVATVLGLGVGWLVYIPIYLAFARLYKLRAQAARGGQNGQ